MVAVSAALAVAAGLCSGVQSPTNASLSVRVGNAQATLTSFSVGLVVIVALALAAGTGDIAALPNAPVWQWLGGLYGAFSVIAVTYATPVLGVALTLTGVMLGELLGGAVIDWFGLLGCAPVAASPLRIAGIAAVAVGVLAVNRGRAARTPGARMPGSRAMLPLALLAGAAMAVQAPTNAGLATTVGTLEASCVSFAGGVAAMLVFCLVSYRGRLRRPVGAKPWEFLGGVYGAVVVLLTTLSTPVLGVGLTMSAIMFGQMAAGMVIDSFGLLNVVRVPPSRWRVAGCVLIAAGVALVCANRVGLG